MERGASGGEMLAVASLMRRAGSSTTAWQPGHLFWASRRKASASSICWVGSMATTMWSTPMVVLTLCAGLLVVS
ncbi:hypothetical protein D5R93_10370 [Actinomyces lilanjuaniae]|uniref:Uncharacterized protein n=1 Tax=Actinomyces lilanjuaniae TaxID=2321394 RepID=A0ABM6Z4Q7_9ACTO|nr:hypothetical protein D5R93_10370 [Actinomyces lilanjuaniae]